ncbi:hypothetical protein [Roseisolibacter agri]|uniref:Uncharacterized protein n=1 Tax=Roseisolibacter agri TaxID=2014610 RepID=A0AA37QIG2_9BACT|nr:hypothetical protein [Roseisolibacter agri]GLC27105.1 hypothetical protein rosag_36180 [Roseisolibacter agri]
MRPVSLLTAALLLGAAPLAAQGPARPAAFDPSGRYAMKLVVGRDTVPFTIVVADSGGRWGGTFIGSSGRVRPLISVVPRDGDASLVIQWAETNAFATVLLRLRPDNTVRGAAEYPDGTFTLLGTRTPK